MVFIVCSIFFETFATLLAIPEEKHKCIDIESACQLLSRPQVEKFLSNNICPSKVNLLLLHACHSLETEKLQKAY
jgi:hypothetical protein